MVNFEPILYEDFRKNFVYVWADTPLDTPYDRVRCGTSVKYMDDLKGVENSRPYRFEIIEELKPEFSRRIETRQFEPCSIPTVLVLSTDR